MSCSCLPIADTFVLASESRSGLSEKLCLCMRRRSKIAELLEKDFAMFVSFNAGGERQLLPDF